MLSWVSLWIGLRSRTRFRAVITALVTVVLWVVLPVLLVVLADEVFSVRLRTLGDYLIMLSPGSALCISEFEDTPYNTPPLRLLLVSSAWHMCIMLYFRHLCLGNADRLLGRVPENPESRKASATHDA